MYLVLGDSATKLALFVLYALIARVLGTRGFGDYTVAISLSFFVTSAALGIDVIVSREVARDPKNIDGLFWDSIVLKLAAGLPILGLVTGFAAVSNDKPTIVISVALLGLSNLLDVVAQSPHAVLRGVEDMAPTSLALVLEGIVEVGLAVVVLSVFSASLVALGAVAVIASLVAMAYIWVALDRRGFRPHRRGTSRGKNWLLIAAIPTGITSIFGYLLGRLDAVLLSLITHNPHKVGLYGAAYRLFEGTLFLSWAVALAVFPVLSRLPRRSSDLRRAFEVSTMVAAGISIPLGAAMALFGPVLVTDVFGQSYAGAGSTTRLLGVCTGIYGVYVLAAFTLAAQDRQHAFPILAGAALLVNVVLNLTLIPALGLSGAAIAMDVAQGLLTVLMLWLVTGIIGRYSLARILCSSIVGGAAMVIVAQILGSDTVGLVVALVCFYPAFLGTEWTLHRDDLADVVAALRRGPGVADGAVDPVLPRAPAPGSQRRRGAARLARWRRR